MTMQRTASSARGRPLAPIDDAVADAVLRRLASARSVALRMQEIADDVGVHRSTLYRRWPTEQALLALALERTASRLRDELDEAGIEPAELLARIAVLLDSRAGRGLVRAQIVVGTTRVGGGSSHSAASRGPEADPMLDMLVGAVIHRLFVLGLPCDAPWQHQVLIRLTDAPSPDAGAA